MTFIQDGVKAYCLPETACCKLCGKNPLMDIDECPTGKETCSGDCEHYTEDEQYSDKVSQNIQTGKISIVVYHDCDE